MASMLEVNMHCYNRLQGIFKTQLYKFIRNSELEYKIQETPSPDESWNFAKLGYPSLSKNTNSKAVFVL